MLDGWVRSDLWVSATCEFFGEHFAVAEDVEGDFEGGWMDCHPAEGGSEL